MLLKLRKRRTGALLAISRCRFGDLIDPTTFDETALVLRWSRQDKAQLQRRCPDRGVVDQFEEPLTVALPDQCTQSPIRRNEFPNPIVPLQLTH